MKEVAPKLWIGNDADFKDLDQFGTDWIIIHAAKYPYHRDFVGYKTAAAPDGPERLWARRNQRLALNLIDAPEPKYIPKALIDTAMAFLDEHLPTMKGSQQCLIHCNKGESRAPTLALLYMAPALSLNFEEAVKAYKELYPAYTPGNGVREFARIHWKTYHNRKATPQTAPHAPVDKELDIARKLIEGFCDDLKSAPDKAVDNLISGIVRALKDAGENEPSARRATETEPNVPGQHADPDLR